MADAAGSPEARIRLAREIPVTLLERLAAECGRRGPLQLQDFVAKVALDPKDAGAAEDAGAPGGCGRRCGGRRRPGPGRGVCISTIHAAKGLEWPVVFVAHWNQGFLPMDPQAVEELHPDGHTSKRDPTDSERAEHLEEERRLAHVAVTRAQRRLILTYVRWMSEREPEPAAISSLPLPEPQEAEGTPHAAIWMRERPMVE